MLFFFALGNLNDLPTFFLLIHMQPEALVVRFRTNDWCSSVLGCIKCFFIFHRDLSERLDCDGWVVQFGKGSTTPVKARICCGHEARTQPPENRVETPLLFLKIFHDLSQRKSTRRAQWMKWKKKEIFVFFFSVIADIFCETSILHAMYIKHKLSDSCSFACFYYINISNVYAFIYALPQL